MNNITDLTVTQIRIFPVDVVPLAIITTKSCIDKVRNAFSIGEVELRPFIEGKQIIVFGKGELRTEKSLIVLNKVEVDPRRIILEVNGTSNNGDEIYESFLSVISSVASIDLPTLRTPLFVAQTTQCVLALDFASDALFSTSFTDFLNRNVRKEANSKAAKASVRPLAAIAEISYEITDKTLLDNNITLNSKQFSISPRPGAPLNTKKYVISSPFDSDTHLKLIKKLNSIFAGAT